ncbi:B-cell receptor CD22-like [Silurus meridionalis]|uniref:B-cell receptor CD22-like n=1 Tax=Silurus meridionalis TaxID=175797 RepID=UPI001EE9CD51|nr:B-cell receptor CD22-like [Silurus meridionalis]
MTRKFTAAAAAAILMLLIGVQAQPSVTFSTQSLCAVTGSTVKIPCTFTKPDHSSVTQREWYQVQSSEGEPQELSKDPQYSGRVYVSTWWSDCELTVRNVRLSDSGVYNFRFKTQSSKWISAPSGVHLTVTDLQVKVDPNTEGQRKVKVTCSSTCSLSPYNLYWYKNGYYIKPTNENFIVLDSTNVDDEGSYSCRVYESERRSPPVCVMRKACWRVTYTPDHVCALKGTSVDLSCSYTHPAEHTVRTSVWFIKQKAEDDPVDVREDEEYQGRVQDTQNSQNNCSLRITNLRETDAQTYRFRFYTDQDKYTGNPGVSLSVTDLKVTVSDWRNGYKMLSCITTCTLSNNPTYIWYKNGQRVPDQNRNELDLDGSSDGSYSCAVTGHENLHSPAVYSPKNIRAEVLPTGDLMEGDLVTLSCSSDANPPVLTYSWFKQIAGADTLLSTGQNHSISNISSLHSGLYYCTAYNQLGHHNSTPVHLNVLGSKNNTALKFSMVALVVFLAVTLVSGALWMWKRKSSSANKHSSTAESEQLQSAPVYDNIPASNHRVTSDDQENITYTSVAFKHYHTEEGSLSPRLPPDTTDEEEVEYAAVNIQRNTAATQLDGANDDSSQIYSKVSRKSKI